MMSEKEKRKEKPNQNERRFIWLGILFFLVVIVWGFLFGILLIPKPISWRDSTITAIVQTNEVALTQISASATAEATTHRTSNTRATETMEYVQTLAHVRETMTALGDWSWREATATAEAGQGQ